MTSQSKVITTYETRSDTGETYQVDTCPKCLPFVEATRNAVKHGLTHIAERSRPDTDDMPWPCACVTVD